MKLLNRNYIEEVRQEKDLLLLLFFYASVLLLIVSVFLVVNVWFLVLTDGLKQNFLYTNNYMPWPMFHYYPGDDLIWPALQLQSSSLTMQVTSLLLRRNRRIVWLLSITVFTILVTTDMPYWLIDYLQKITD